ncbi:MAG: hypothetical protein ACYDB7_14095 [Mycobacteriales bacterium]
MSRRGIALALAGATLSVGGALAIPAATAVSTVGAMPPPCPVGPLVSVSNGNLYVHVGCASVVVPLPGLQTPQL